MNFDKALEKGCPERWWKPSSLEVSRVRQDRALSNMDLAAGVPVHCKGVRLDGL